MVDAQPRAKHVRRVGIGHDHFGERLAGVGIEQAEMMVDFEWRVDQPVLDAHQFHVLDVAEPGGQRQPGRIAPLLGLDIQIGRVLQPAACAGDLR